MTKDELEFIAYWEEKRKQNKYNPALFGKGFAIGIIAVLAYHFSFGIDWDKHAYNLTNLAVMPIAYMAIIAFCAWFYNSFKYEQNEQLYQELKKKMDK